MPTRVDIISKKEVFKKSIFKVDEAHLRYEKYDGTMTGEITRLNFNRGDSSAVVLHDREADRVVLTEQFRYPAYEKGNGWLLEIPAGTVEMGEDPKVTMQREITEEIGYKIRMLKKICTFYVSPGGTSERIHLYYARVTQGSKKGKGGGLAEEGEDIRVVTLKVNAALRMIDTGEIIDAKTIIGLQWLQLNRSV